jgi:GAF domain-containing protein
LQDTPLQRNYTQLLPKEIQETQEIQNPKLSLINYVTRTLKTLVIDDATAETTFADDPYIIEHQPKSLLCTPIRKQGKLMGILSRK